MLLIIVIVTIPVVYVVGLAFFIRDWLEKRRRANVVVPPFDRSGKTHHGSIVVKSTAGEKIDQELSRQREAHALHYKKRLAVKARLVLEPGDREDDVRLRQWHVVDRKVDKREFGLRVSTGEVIPVVLRRVDERVAMRLRIVGRRRGTLECIATLKDKTKVTIDGVIDSDGRLRAERIEPRRAYKPDPRDTSVASKLFVWTVLTAMVAAGAVVFFAAVAARLLLALLTLVFGLVVGIARYRGQSATTPAVAAHAAMAPRMPNYSVHSIVRLPLAVKALR